MALAETGYEHIVVDEHGVPWIEDANMKVIELALDQQAYGGTPDQLQVQHPYLTFGQIHSAFAYYWDHKVELDSDIERRWQRVEQLHRESQPSPFLERLTHERQSFLMDGE